MCREGSQGIGRAQTRRMASTQHLFRSSSIVELAPTPYLTDRVPPWRTAHPRLRLRQESKIVQRITSRLFLPRASPSARPGIIACRCLVARAAWARDTRRKVTLTPFFPLTPFFLFLGHRHCCFRWTIVSSIACFLTSSGEPSCFARSSHLKAF